MNRTDGYMDNDLNWIPVGKPEGLSNECLSDLQKKRDDYCRRLNEDAEFYKTSEPLEFQSSVDSSSDSREHGVKHDQGKVRAGLVLQDFACALEEVCEVGTFGAEKYTDHGWLDVPNASDRYEDAMIRHYLAHCQGKQIDRESGLSHLAHMAWNVLAILELEHV